MEGAGAMLVRTLEDVTGTRGEEHGCKWHNMRLLHPEDGAGLVFADCILEEGYETAEGPQHHTQVCYCLEGEGYLEELEAGLVHKIKPGTLFALDAQGGHRLRADTRMRMIRTFAPAHPNTETQGTGG